MFHSIHSLVCRTCFAGASCPAVRARTVELSTFLDALAAIGTGPSDAGVLNDLTVEAGESLRTPAEVLVWVGVLAGSTVLTGFVGPAVIEI